MKLPKTFVEDIYKDIDDTGIACFEEAKKLVIILAYSVLLNYHIALSDELLKSGIDIGILQFDK